jgi:hypothetical protein
MAAFYLTLFRSASRYYYTLHWLSEPLTVAFAAGGIKLLLELFKTWVEDRKGRKIRIKKGDIEIDLEGGVSKEQVEQALKILEEHFEESKIIKL